VLTLLFPGMACSTTRRGPVSKATVKLRATTGSLEFTATTTTSGEFSFAEIADGTYNLSVSAGGHTWKAMIKDTSFGKRGNRELGVLEFRAEFFNVFNTAGSSRQIQFSLKLIY
jgi:Carboxypeptidase regulatory-like domain